MNILIDDMRDRDDGIICRDFESAKMVLSMIGNTDKYKSSTLWLDHDLGQGDGKEGIDILKWARCYKINLPTTIILVTANPVGFQNMANLLTHDMDYVADFHMKEFKHA